jgi:hypothetical protein
LDDAINSQKEHSYPNRTADHKPRRVLLDVLLDGTTCTAKGTQHIRTKQRGERATSSVARTISIKQDGKSEPFAYCSYINEPLSDTNGIIHHSTIVDRFRTTHVNCYLSPQVSVYEISPS